MVRVLYCLCKANVCPAPHWQLIAGFAAMAKASRDLISVLRVGIIPASTQLFLLQHPIFLYNNVESLARGSTVTWERTAEPCQWY